jgi:hypothetical protein
MHARWRGVRLLVSRHRRGQAPMCGNIAVLWVMTFSGLALSRPGYIGARAIRAGHDDEVSIH